MLFKWCRMIQIIQNCQLGNLLQTDWKASQQEQLGESQSCIDPRFLASISLEEVKSGGSYGYLLRIQRMFESKNSSEDRKAITCAQLPAFSLSEQET